MSTSLIFLALLLGFCKGAQFQNPLKDETWPDPFCYLHTDGFYYMPRKENVSIALYKSPILHNWRDAERSVVYTAPDGLLNLWAPEIFYLRENFYMYFALDNGDNRNHRMYVIRATNVSEPMGSWGVERRYF
jgi:GH43 family beta-xylosidase